MNQKSRQIILDALCRNNVFRRVDNTIFFKPIGTHVPNIFHVFSAEAAFDFKSFDEEEPPAEKRGADYDLWALKRDQSIELQKALEEMVATDSQHEIEKTINSTILRYSGLQKDSIPFSVGDRMSIPCRQGIYPDLQMKDPVHQTFRNRNLCFPSANTMDSLINRIRFSQTWHWLHHATTPHHGKPCTERTEAIIDHLSLCLFQMTANHFPLRTLLVITGEPGCGKSSFFTALKSILDFGLYTQMEYKMVATDFATGNMGGKRLVIIDDIPEFMASEHIQRLKHWSDAQGWLPINQKNQKAYSARFSGLICLASNHSAPFNKLDDGLQSRFFHIHLRNIADNHPICFDTIAKELPMLAIYGQSLVLNVLDIREESVYNSRVSPNTEPSVYLPMGKWNHSRQQKPQINLVKSLKPERNPNYDTSF